MLQELRVRDLGVIGDLTLLPGPGMTVLTGETGAGKTLVVGALALVLGGRATGAPVRPGADEALVEARFSVVDPASAGPAAGPAVDERAGDHELVLARAVPQGGRSRAWRDGRMATAAQLAEVADLVDIHGQHDQHSLVSAAGRRRALDAFAGTDPGPVRHCTRAVEEIDRALAALGGDPAAQAREADVLRYQLNEITEAAISDPDEDERLAEEEERLAEVEAHREAAALAGLALVGDDAGEGGGEDGARHGLDVALTALGERRAFETVTSRLRDVAAELDDATRELRAVGEGLEDDPARLAAVQVRRQLLAQLRRKYGPELRDVCVYAESVRARLADLAGAETRVAELMEARQHAASELAAAQATLRAARVEAAPRLSAAATERLRALAMPRAVLTVAVGNHPAGDNVEILFSADAGAMAHAGSHADAGTMADAGATPGTPPRPGAAAQPLARVASGGELARAALALRLVAVTGPDTMVFDEVDAGVGGEAAVALAAALREVADQRQVLVVTHLPQVAAQGDVHVALHKEEDAGRSITVAEVLDDRGRVVELARMLSGHPDSETAQAHAEELLAGVRGSTAAPTPWR